MTYLQRYTLKAALGLARQQSATTTANRTAKVMRGRRKTESRPPPSRLSKIDILRQAMIMRARCPRSA